MSSPLHSPQSSEIQVSDLADKASTASLYSTQAWGPAFPSLVVDERGRSGQTATSSLYSSSTAEKHQHRPALAHPPPPPPLLPRFPPSFSQHFAARHHPPPPPLDLSPSCLHPQGQHENHPIISLTPSPRVTTYYHHHHASSSSFLHRPRSPTPDDAPRHSDPDRAVSQIIPVSHASTPFVVAATKRLSRRWLGGGGGRTGQGKETRALRSLDQTRWDKAARADRSSSEELNVGIAELRAWSPLRINGGRLHGWGIRGDQEDRKWGTTPEQEAQRRKKRTYGGLLVLSLLLIIGITVTVVVKLINKPSTSSSGSFASTSVPVAAVTVTLSDGSKTTVFSSKSATVPVSTRTSIAVAAATSSAAPPVINLASCLNSFPPSNATRYCSECNEILSKAPNDFLSVSLTGPKGVGQALQFCALRAIYEATAPSEASKTSLGGALNSEGSPWFGVSGDNVCTWGGITCDTGGGIVQLNLTYPAVPDSIPFAIGNLVGLQTLAITGSTADAIPYGSLPGSVYNLTKLTSLYIESTSIDTPIPKTAFAGMSALQSLILINNQGLGTNLPTGLGETNITTLVVRGQSLSGNQVAFLPKSLTYLDISSNSLASLASDLATALPNLRTLLVTTNSLTSLPSSFPESLQTLSLAGNSGLSGMLPSTLCSSKTLTKCSVEGTSVFGNVNRQTKVGNLTETVTECGPCVF